MKIAIFMLIFVVLSTFASAQNITIHNIPKKNSKYGGYFFIPNVIEIYDYIYDDPEDSKYGQVNEKKYRKNLAHELAHYYCYKWTKDIYCNDINWKKEHDAV